MMTQTMEDGLNKELGKDMKSGSATFTVKIQFARNATWQGTISWLEGQKTQSFRSELEMLRLMTDAVPCEEELNDW